MSTGDIVCGTLFHFKKTSLYLAIHHWNISMLLITISYLHTLYIITVYELFKREHAYYEK